jgi:hypothetical protein
VRERTAACPFTGDGFGNGGPRTRPHREDQTMTRASTIVTIAVLSAILAPVAVSATGTTQTSAAPEQQAKIEKAVLTTTTASAGEPTCARRVKVVYAGYGEGNRGTCSGDVRR